MFTFISTSKRHSTILLRQISWKFSVINNKFNIKPSKDISFIERLTRIHDLVMRKIKHQNISKGDIKMKTVTFYCIDKNYRGEESLTSFQFLFMHKDTNWDGYKICKISLRYTLIVSIAWFPFKCNGYTTCS